MEISAEKKESRRELQKQQIRDSILEAAAHLISTRGVSNLSMDDVAAQAGLSKGSLYNYFANREDLVNTVIESHFQKFLDQASPFLLEDRAPFSKRFELLLNLMLDTMEHSLGVLEIFEFFEIECSLTRSTTGCQIHETGVFNTITRFHKTFSQFYGTACTKKEIRGEDPLALSIAVVTTLFHLFQSSRMGFGIPRNTIVPFMLRIYLP